MYVAHIKISYSTLLRKRWQCVCVCLTNWKLVVVKIKEMREKKEREGWRDKQTHRSKEREREQRRGGEGGRGDAGKYLERRRIICAVVGATSPGCSPTATRAAFPTCFQKPLLRDETMWIYKLVFGFVFVVSCSGKFAENYSQLLPLLPNVWHQSQRVSALVCAPCTTNCQARVRSALNNLILLLSLRCSDNNTFVLCLTLYRCVINAIWWCAIYGLALLRVKTHPWQYFLRLDFSEKRCFC